MLKFPFSRNLKYSQKWCHLNQYTLLEREIPKAQGDQTQIIKNQLTKNFFSIDIFIIRSEWLNCVSKLSFFSAVEFSTRIINESFDTESA